MAKFSAERISTMSFYELSQIWDNYWDYEAALDDGSVSKFRMPSYIAAIGEEIDNRLRGYIREVV